MRTGNGYELAATALQDSANRDELGREHFAVFPFAFIHKRKDSQSSTNINTY